MDFVSLTVVSSAEEAEALRELLQASGIDCSVRGTDLTPSAYAPPLGANWREVLVIDDQYEAARAIYESYSSSRD